MANLEWRNLYPDAEVEVGATVNSDHAPLILNLLGVSGIARQRKGSILKLVGLRKKVVKRLCEGARQLLNLGPLGGIVWSQN